MTMGRTVALAAACSLSGSLLAVVIPPARKRDASMPGGEMERVVGLEPTTFTLAT